MDFTPSICTLSVFLALVVWVFVRRSNEPELPLTCPMLLRNNKNLVPRLIQDRTTYVWMYWDHTPLPSTVDLCHRNWARMASSSSTSFSVILVTQKTLSNFIDADAHPCLSNKNTNWRALRSDFIRLSLLHRFGGVYMDATCILTENLDWVATDDGLQCFQAYYNPRNMTLGCHKPVIENSFLVAPAAHPFVTQWLATLSELRTCDEEGIERALGNTPTQVHMKRYYHFAYHCVTKMLSKHRLDDYAPYRLRTVASGKYLNFLNQTVHDLSTKGATVAHGPVLKLIAFEREDLEARLSVPLDGGASDVPNVQTGSFIWKYLLAGHAEPQSSSLWPASSS
tara:strand:+ start:2502 stop:3518 length:1017 start_codon:yes stop_codon:yes gene_type:complete